jgi:antiphage defense system Thoeris ThsB-like protein
MAKRVYFAFDYADVGNFRANVVRNHKMLKGVEAAGYYDHSIWEDAKTTGVASIKRLIDNELENTSVTAVLIGSRTWYRRWVRYEIFRSVQRGNKVVGIHINSIQDKNEMTEPLGADPFFNMGIQIGDNLSVAKPTEWDGEKWIFNSDVEPWRIEARSANEKGTNFRLTTWFVTYDWVANDGFNNFSSWIG